MHLAAVDLLLLGQRWIVASLIPNLVELARVGNRVSFVAIESGSWVRIRHVPGPIWSLDDRQGEFFFGPPEMTGPVTEAIALARQRMAAAEWRDIDEVDPDWPDAAP